MIITADLVALLKGADMTRNWRAGSACSTGEHPPDWWGGEVPVTAKAAKAVCVTCPARPECLTYSLDDPDQYGILGGFDRRERNDLIRQLGRRPR